MGEDGDESSGESSASSPRSGGCGGGRGRKARAKVATLQMCPLDLRFSQKKMRSVFMDGRSVEAASDLVSAVRRDADEADLYGAPWRLEAPFPPIELLRFRCKLRDENTGRPLTDPETGEELMEEESWFTLDNRRLCCLQMAAIQLLPERCTVAVVAEMPKGARRMREIRKFRTLDSGKSIMVGSVVDGVPFERWDWRARAAEIAAGGGRGSGGGGGGKAVAKSAGKKAGAGGGKPGEGGRGSGKGGYSKAGTVAANGVSHDGDGGHRGKGGKRKGGKDKGAPAYTGDPLWEGEWGWQHAGAEAYGDDSLWEGTWGWQQTVHSGDRASGAKGAGRGCSGGGKGKAGGKCKGGGSGGDGGSIGKGGYGKKAGRGGGKATSPEACADAEATDGQAAPPVGRRRRHGRAVDGATGNFQHPP